MKRIRIEKPKPARERWWLGVLPLDPRDPDIVRARALVAARRDRLGDAARKEGMR